VDLSTCYADWHDGILWDVSTSWPSWFARIGITHSAVQWFALPEKHVALRSAEFRVLEHDLTTITLSLLDVAIISRDVQKSRILHSIGVPQRNQFLLRHIYQPRTGVADNRSARAVMIAKDVCQPLYEEMRCDDQLLGRAIAGKQNFIVTLLSNDGIAASSALRQVAHFMFVIKPLESREHCRLSLRMACLEIAVAAGIDLRSLRVDPYCALQQAIRQHRCEEIRRHMRSHLCRFLDGPRPPKWRTAQTLLDMAIRCGQLDVTRYVLGAKLQSMV